MKLTRVLLLIFALPVSAFATNAVVNLSHYDMMRPNFIRMKSEGIVGVIHELTKPLPGDSPRVRRVQFSAIFCGVRMSAVRYLKSHRLN